jgi:small GTP-binding protein
MNQGGGISLQPELLKTFQGTGNDRIHVLAWSPDGSLLAAGLDRGIQIWDVAAGVATELQTDAEVYRLAWSPDGRLLASSYRGKPKVSIWEIDNRTEQRQLQSDETRQAFSVFSIAWSHVTGALALGSGNGSIEVWDTESWRLVSRPQQNVGRIIYEVAWAPDGILLASAEQRSQPHFWNSRTGGADQAIHGHSDFVRTVAWSPTGDLLASGDDKGAVLLWSPHDTAPPTRLEGHVDITVFVRFSRDGRLLASESVDRTIRIWDTHTCDPLAVIQGPERDRQAFGCEIGFHPSAARLATLDQLGTSICIWQLDPQNLTASDVEAIRYTTARIVLVGDSGVGKTGLGWRLSQGQFKEHPSTHGQQFWTLDQLEATRADGVQCEAVLWDLAGQPDYRLVHSLFLDTIDLALLLFDPTNRQEPLAGVDYWLRHLQTTKSEPPPVILVGARIDRGSSTLTEAEFVAVCDRRGISGGYIATSAKDGDGLDELISQIRSLIPWAAMSATVTTTTFKRVRDYVLSLKEDAARVGMLVSASALRRRLESAEPDWRFSDAEMITAVRHLETHGYVKLLWSTAGDEFVLLAPEVLSKLASSIVLEARRETHGLGALHEARLLEGDYRLPELDNLDRNERRILLDAVVLLFLEHNVCFREYLGSRVLLVFPSLINEQRPLINEFSVDEDISYTVSGAVENVYAALVVLLGYTNTFTRTHQWKNQAQYELGNEEICGFRQVDAGGGSIELILYYGTTTPERVKLLFQGLFETFLIRRDLNIVRYRPVCCRNCSEHQDRAVVVKQISRGRAFIFCANCGSKVEIPSPEDLTITATSNEEVHEQQQVADFRTSFEAGLVSVKSLLLERGDAGAKPTCFISYAWGVLDDENWVLQLAKDLRNADIDVLLDRWHSSPGSDLGRYIDRILSSQFVIVVGTPELRQKYEVKGADPVVAAELELIDLRLRQPKRYGSTVLPVLLHGAAHEVFTPSLQKLVNIDFRKEDMYFSQLFVVLWKLWALPFDHPLLEELRESITGAAP